MYSWHDMSSPSSTQNLETTKSLIISTLVFSEMSSLSLQLLGINTSISVLKDKQLNLANTIKGANKIYYFHIKYDGYKPWTNQCNSNQI